MGCAERSPVTAVRGEEAGGLQRAASLRTHVTLVCVLVLALCCAVLTVGNNWSASRMADAIETVPVLADPPIEDGPAGVVGGAVYAPALISSTARSDYRVQSLVGMVAIVALGTCAVYGLVGRALAPLEDVAFHIKRLSASDLGERIEVPRRPREVADLAAAFNEMTARLDEAFARQRRFAQNAAHELRTPLAVVKTNVQLFRKRQTGGRGFDAADNGRLGHLLDLIDGQIDRLSEVVRRLLEMATAQGVRLEERVDLHALALDGAAALAGLAAERGAQVQVEPFEAEVLGDRELLARVLGNLIENALRYGPAGGTVCVSCEQAGTVLRLCVDDEGPGVDPALREQVFEPFFRVDASRSRDRGGAGLGLALVRSVAEAHGGSASIGDAPGGGCRVVVELPG